MQSDRHTGDTPANYSRNILSAYSKVPILRALPPRAVGIVLVLIGVNLAVWIVVGIVSHFFQGLAGLGVLAWSLGLRHALDADHISAIDLMTRRLVASNQRPVTVGTFFSLGHSTIVIVTAIVVAATAAAVSDRFDGFSQVGGIIGSAVSAAFLLVLGIANAYILVLLVRQLRRTIDHYQIAVHSGTSAPTIDFGLHGGGVFFRVFKRLFVLIDRPWKMYPLGVLFGLGFDTSSQVALLGISAVQSASGRSFWLILIFPLLFTVGMCLLDTLDGALMLSLYTAGAGMKPNDREPLASLDRPEAEENDGREEQHRSSGDNTETPTGVNCQPAADTLSVKHPAERNAARPDALTMLYYNFILTVLTVTVAVVIGVIQILGLVDSICSPPGRFWDGVRKIEDKFDILGGAICGTFAIVAIVGALLQQTWRRWVLAIPHRANQN